MDGSPITWSLTEDEKETLRRRIPEAAAWASQPWPSPMTDTSFRSRDLWPEGYSDASYSWWEPPPGRIKDWIEEVSTKRAQGIAELSLEVHSLETALEKGSILAHNLGGCIGDWLASTSTPFFDKLDNGGWDTWLLLARNASAGGGFGPLWLSWIPREHVEEVQSAIDVTSTDCLLWVDARELGLLQPDE
jgi:hypothetical protein